MKLIVGLGNHGNEYAHTRHNFGWDAVTALADKLERTFQTKARFQAEIAEGRIDDEKVLLVRPLTYMNHSGETVESILSFYKLDKADLLVVHDEMDYPVGKLGFCAQAGPAGHNGIRSIHERLGTEEVSRLRLGIGRPAGRLPVDEYVLQSFSQMDQPVVKEILHSSIQALEDWIRVGTTKAMNKWNTTQKSL